MAHPWLVPPADFNPEGISWAIKCQTTGATTRVVSLYECTTSEPAGVELSEWEVPPEVTEGAVTEWLAGYMPGADALRMSRATIAALAQR